MNDSESLVDRELERLRRCWKDGEQVQRRLVAQRKQRWLFNLLGIEPESPQSELTAVLSDAG